MHWAHRSHAQLMPEAVRVHHSLLPLCFSLKRLLRLGKLEFPWLGVEILLCESSRFLIALDNNWGTFCVRSDSRCVAGQESVSALRFVFLELDKIPASVQEPPGTLRSDPKPLAR